MRAVPVLLLLAATLPAQEVFAHRARLSRTSVRQSLRRNYALPEGRVAVEEPAARRGSVDRLSVLFFDVDGDGRFGEAGVDGWMLQDMRYLLPMESTTVLELSSIRWKVDPDGASVHYDSEPVPVDGAQRKTFRQFNYWRLINGLPPVHVDEPLCAACTKHCSYATFYHRLPLIHPDTRAIGIGNSGRYTAVDGLSRRAPRSWRYPVIVPAPNSALQPTHFARESPRPHSEDMTPGFPITRLR